MPLRFFRRVKIAPGVTVNLSKSGTSVSVGPRGAKTTFGHGRIRRTIGLPGTGLYYTDVTSTNEAPPSSAVESEGAPSPAAAISSDRREPPAEVVATTTTAPYLIALVVAGAITLVAWQSDPRNLPGTALLLSVGCLAVAWLWVHHHIKAAAETLLVLGGALLVAILAVLGLVLTAAGSSRKR